jgi:hypothetical protein
MFSEMLITLISTITRTTLFLCDGFHDRMKLSEHTDQMGGRFGQLRSRIYRPWKYGMASLYMRTSLTRNTARPLVSSDRSPFVQSPTSSAHNPLRCARRPPDFFYWAAISSCRLSSLRLASSFSLNSLYRLRASSSSSFRRACYSFRWALSFLCCTFSLC